MVLCPIVFIMPWTSLLLFSNQIQAWEVSAKQRCADKCIRTAVVKKNVQHWLVFKCFYTASFNVINLFLGSSNRRTGKRRGSSTGNDMREKGQQTETDRQADRQRQILCAQSDRQRQILCAQNKQTEIIIIIPLNTCNFQNPRICSSCNFTLPVWQGPPCEALAQVYTWLQWSRSCVLFPVPAFSALALQYSHRTSHLLGTD